MMGRLCSCFPLFLERCKNFFSGVYIVGISHYLVVCGNGLFTEPCFIGWNAWVGGLCVDLERKGKEGVGDGLGFVGVFPGFDHLAEETVSFGESSTVTWVLMDLPPVLIVR